MEYKDQLMSAQDVSSIGRHCTATIHLCLRSGPRWPVTAGLHGAVVAVVVPGSQSQKKGEKRSLFCGLYTKKKKMMGKN